MTKKKELTNDERTATSGRRGVIKGLAAGGTIAAGLKGLPDSWTKPMVDAVVLPAHAQLSLRDPCDIDVEFIDDTIRLIVTGNVFGGGDLGGLDIDIEVELLFNGSVVDTDEQNNVTTDPDGSYGPIQFDFPGACNQAVNGARAIVTSDSPGLEGQVGDCETSFPKGCLRRGP